MKLLTAATAVLLLGAACTSAHSTAKPASTTTSAPTTTSTPTTTTTVATSTTRPRSTTTTLAPLRPRPCCSTTPGGPLRVSFTGLTAGQHNDGRAVDFTVTFTNGTSTNYAAVSPVVATAHSDVRPGPTGEADGRLQRYNRSSGAWEDLPLSEGEGMDFMYTGDEAAFPLPPGHSVSVQYRISLTRDDGPGTLPIDGLASKTSDHSDIGNIDVPVVVTSG